MEKRRQVLWQATGSLEPAVDPATWAGKVVPDVLDGVFSYRIMASDQLTWLDLHVRVRPDNCAAPQAYDIGLHTCFHLDPQGDRWLDFTSALHGARFVGYIHALHNPHPAFWTELERQFMEWDVRARAAYATDMKKLEAAQLEKAAARLTSGGEFPNGIELSPVVEMRMAYYAVGTSGNVVLIEAVGFDQALVKYRAHVDRQVADVQKLLELPSAITPNYDLRSIELVGPVAIVH